MLDSDICLRVRLESVDHEPLLAPRLPCSFNDLSPHSFVIAIVNEVSNGPQLCTWSQKVPLDRLVATFRPCLAKTTSVILSFVLATTTAPAPT